MLMSFELSIKTSHRSMVVVVVVVRRWGGGPSGGELLKVTSRGSRPSSKRPPWTHNAALENVTTADGYRDVN